MNSPIFRAAIQETIRSKNVTNRSPPCRFKASNGRRARGLPRLRFTGSATIRCMGKRGIFPGSRLESRP